MKLSDKAKKLANEYEQKYNKLAKGWEYDKETMEEYEKYLENELNKNKAL